MPIIALSRQYGSGGSEVAAVLASTLGWDLLDNAVIDEVAARTGLSATEVAEREERMPSLAERVVDTMAMGTQETLSPLAHANIAPNDEYLLETTRRVITEAAARGPVVIVGRGAHQILGSRDDVLSALCYSPRSALIERTMERDHVDAAGAAKIVDEKNKQRAEWVKAHWNREWLALEHYHVCVNTKALGIEGAAQVIVGVARQRFSIGS